MTINARCQVTSNTSYLNYDSDNNIWEGVIIRVYYPVAQVGQISQSYSLNPPLIGDYIIDESSKVWKIELVDTTWTPKTSNFHFRVNIKVQNRIASEEVEPECGVTNYGAVCTPVNNALNPLTDTSMVMPSVISNSISFNIEKELLGGGSGSTGESESDIFDPITSDTNLEVGKTYPIDTSLSAITLTLPTGEIKKNSVIRIIDMGKASTNNITINGDIVLGVPDSSILVDTDYGIGTFRRVDDTYGWSYDNTGY